MSKLVHTEDVVTPGPKNPTVEKLHTAVDQFLYDLQAFPGTVTTHADALKVKLEHIFNEQESSK